MASIILPAYNPRPLAITNATVLLPIAEQPIVDNYLPGSHLVELLIVYNDCPLKNHWAFFVRSQATSDIGAVIHVTGNIKNGFKFEIKRNYNFQRSGARPFKRIPLQWIEGKNVNERAMLNGGHYTLDSTPVCEFEISVHKVFPPGKSPYEIDNTLMFGKMSRKDCQTWIIESANQLAKDGILHPDIVSYLSKIKQ